MLKGLRQRYLESVAPMNMNESDVTHAAIFRSNMIEQDALQWRSLWQTILRLFFPSFNNVYVDGGTNGEIRFNEVLTSDPTTYLMKQVEFLMRSMFPQQTPWKGVGVYDQGGRTVERGKLSTQMLQHLDDVVNVLRYLLKYGGFYDQIRQSLLHFLLLGNACMRVSPSGSEWGALTFTDVPIAKIGVQRDSFGKVYALSWTETMERWEVVRSYGQEGLALFEQTNLLATSPEKIMTMQRMFGGTTSGGAVGFTGMPVATTGTALGTANNPQKTHAVETLRLLIPNTGNTGVPNSGRLFPEMGYICYVMTKKTKRLLDVEMYTTIPYGVATDVRVDGETYGRGMCGRVLPDVGVLNSKKKIELISDRVCGASPLKVTGTGLQRPISSELRPFELIPLKPGTNMEPIFDANSMWRRNRAIYEEENLSVKRGMEVDNIEPEYKDRMTGMEFTRRQDTSQSQFLPKSNNIYDQLVHPVLQEALNHAYLVGRLQPPPEEMLLSGLNFRLETYSTFTYGQNSEKGYNINRALAPLGDIPSAHPEILDNIDFNKVLRSQFSHYEMAHWLRNTDEVDQMRQRRAELESMQRGGGGQNNLPPEQKGFDKGVAQNIQQSVATGGADDVSFTGLS